jgi:hypothetical protein
MNGCKWRSGSERLDGGRIIIRGPGVNSIDEIIELYKRDLDMTMIEESLRRTVEERLQALEDFERFREELQAGMERQRRRDTLR